MTAREDKIVEAMQSFGAKRWFPSRELHARRNEFNFVPQADAEITDTGDTRRIGRTDCKVYRDSLTGWLWVRMPWWRALLHNPVRNHKFLAFDDDIVAHAPSSSEFIVPKAKALTIIEGRKTYQASDMSPGSYNFKTLGARHYFADVFPPALYCKCVGA